MATLLNSPENYFKNLGGITSQAIAADTTSAAIDTNETFEELMLVINAGVCTNGTYAVKIISDDVSGGSFSTVNYTSETITSANDEKVIIASVRGFKRYIKVFIDEIVNGNDGVIIGVAVLGVEKYI